MRYLRAEARTPNFSNRIVIMYEWRKLTESQREFILKLRKSSRVPWHHLQHRDLGSGSYHITAACYEHRPILGHSAQRMASFEQDLLNLIKSHADEIHAWCILPNHYHLLVHCPKVKRLLSALGKLHGRTSYNWNGEEQTRGRKVWFDAMERAMRSEAHFWATMNYVHHNPVHHCYVSKWQDWPFSSASDFIKNAGKEETERIWKEYPILDYGKDWDPPDL
jgi:putative transposase